MMNDELKDKQDSFQFSANQFVLTENRSAFIVRRSYLSFPPRVSATMPARCEP
jgi:hypothetical protein